MLDTLESWNLGSARDVRNENMPPRRWSEDGNALSTRTRQCIVIASVAPVIFLAAALVISIWRQDGPSSSASALTARFEPTAIRDDSDNDAAAATTAATAPNLRSSTIAGFDSTTLEEHDSDLSGGIVSSTRGTSSSSMISSTSSSAGAEFDTHSTNSVSSTGLTSAPGSLTSEWILNFDEDDENDKNFDGSSISVPPTDGPRHQNLFAADTSTNPTTSFASTDFAKLQLSTSSFALPTPSTVAPPSLELDQSQFPHTIPSFRFVAWSRLDPQTREFAAQMEYSLISWNSFNHNPIEDKGWAEMTSVEQLAAKQLGYTPTSWDCFANHYRAKTWDDLLLVESQDSYRELGWTRLLWTGVGRVPASERKYWKDLTPNERMAANRLCYFEETWDNIFDMTPNASYFPYPLPMFRLHPWSELSMSVAGWARAMYNETSWNSFTENRSFDDLSDDERQAALEIGFVGSAWDCFQDHYDSYYWRSIPPNQVIALEALGWTRNRWSGSISSPDSERKEWVELDPLEKVSNVVVEFLSQ